MKIYHSAFFLIFIFSSGVIAKIWEFQYRTADVKYAVYGVSLGDPVAPSRSDNKIAFELQGQVAREMFEAMGSDKKDSCSQDQGVRFRSSDDEKVVCTKSKEGEYSCSFGLDIKSGKSIGGSIC